MEKIISITEFAKDFFKKSASDEKCFGVRIDTAPGGCQGMNYLIDFVKEVDPADVLVEEDGLNVYIAPKAMLFVAGMTVDYRKTAMGGTVVFENPNAKQTCSCGKSFQMDGSESPCAGFCCGN
ncbi:hypothetical protein FACS189449_04500 [Alphaproteobacteria bacterium]|nr:hypothetical protein FACS189449_04500 [Alphaproteobacteria bacterium]